MTAFPRIVTATDRDGGQTVRPNRMIHRHYAEALSEALGEGTEEAP